MTTKSDKWAHQVETRLLAVNDLRNPGIEIKNAPSRPRVEIPQPRLKANITEIVMDRMQTTMHKRTFGRSWTTTVFPPWKLHLSQRAGRRVRSPSAVDAPIALLDGNLVSRVRRGNLRIRRQAQL